MIEKWINKLKEKDMRITEQRETIVAILESSLKALEPIEVYDLGRKKYPNLGIVTVYRTIDCLEELGLLQKVHQKGSCNKYIKVIEGHNHLLICQNCGRTTYFEGLDIEQQFDQIVKNNNFILQDHWLQLEGICHNCQSLQEKNDQEE